MTSRRFLLLMIGVVAVGLSFLILLPSLSYHAGIVPTQRVAGSVASAEQLLLKAKPLAPLRLQLFAQEPAVSQPIALAIDDRGRVWVAECRSYETPDAANSDQIIVLADEDGDGRHDRRTVFQTGLNRLSGIAVGCGGVWAMCAPHLLFIPDRDADDVPDGEPEIMLTGWDPSPALPWHLPNHLTWGPDSWLYGCSGFSAYSQPRPPGAEPTAHVDAGVWRFHPVTRKFEVVARGTCNPYGIDFDARGRCFVSNNVVEHLWHVVPGAHYERWGSLDEPHIYEPLGSCVDHRHWEGANQWDPTASTAAGGHAHAGLLIYHGGMCAGQFEGQALLANIHGNCVNRDSLTTGPTGVVASHLSNLVDMHDPSFRCVDLKAGLRGEIYLCDWNARGECHSTDDESTGRIFVLSSSTNQTSPVKLSGLSADELVLLQENSNGVLATQARLRLRDLNLRHPISLDIERAIWTKVIDPTLSADIRLRYLWTWSAVASAEQNDKLLTLFGEADDSLRTWAFRLSVDRAGATAALARQWNDVFDLTKSDEECRLLIGLLQQFSLDLRRGMIQSVLARSHPFPSRDCERLLWYAQEECVTSDPRWGVSTIQPTTYDFLNYALARRIASLYLENNDLQAQFEELTKTDDSRLILARLRGVSAAWEGVMKAAPPAWLELVERATAADQPNREELLTIIPWQFLPRTPATFENAVKVAQGGKEPLARRRAAIAYLAEQPTPRSFELVWDLTQDSDEAIASAALQALARFEDANIADRLLRGFGGWSPRVKQSALQTLAARPAFAEKLLTALESNQISEAEVPADIARQLTLLHNGALATRVKQAWGEVELSSASAQAEIKRVRDVVLSRPHLPTRNGSQFQKLCAACHSFKEFREGWAPNLNGASRTNLDNWLSHIIDPSAVVPHAFRNRLFHLHDGRILSGMIERETGAAIVIRGARSSETIARADIESQEVTARSIMPNDLLRGLSDDEIRQLFNYLMTE